MSAHIELIGGIQFPTIGFGTAMFQDAAELERVLEDALSAGYRHFDSGFSYMHSEVTIGKVFKKWITAGKLKREDVFIVTKLPREALHPDMIEESLKTSLERLQMDYVDLYLIHFPIYCLPGQGRVPGDPLPTDHIAVWKKLEEQVDAGKVKALGVSNFNKRQIEKIWQNSRVKPSCLQVKLTPFFQQKDLVKYCQSKDIVVVAYSTLTAPKNVEPGKKPCNIFKNHFITIIAEKHKKSNAQVTLRYFLQKNIVVIPRSTNMERIQQNLDLYNFSLDAEDMKTIGDLDLGEEGRGFTMGDLNPKLKEHPEYPWPEEKL